LALSSGENFVGRDRQSNVQLEHLSVSRRHARIAVSTRDVLLEDLGSKNGTSVGGEPLEKPTRLRDGDQIGFGEVFLTFRESTASLSTETRAGAIEGRLGSCRDASGQGDDA
jgi:pSer/pThr/pTyr-binding forkhead associated (FHA) protein